MALKKTEEFRLHSPSTLCYITTMELSLTHQAGFCIPEISYRCRRAIALRNLTGNDARPKDYGKLFLSPVGARGEHTIVRDEICPVLLGFGESIFPNFMTTISEAGIHWITKLSTNLIFSCHAVLNFLVDCRTSFVLDGFIPA